MFVFVFQLTGLMQTHEASSPDQKHSSPDRWTENGEPYVLDTAPGNKSLLLRKKEEKKKNLTVFIFI